MNALDPLLVGFVRRARRQAMEVEIFRRALSAKAIPQIDFHPANAADSLDSGQLQFAIAQSLRDPSTIRDVAKRRADAVAERKRAHLVVAIRAQGRKALELLARALRHHPAVAPLEFRADDPGRYLPNGSAQDRGARDGEYFLRRAIEGGEAPVRIQREKTLSDPLQESVDGRFRSAGIGIRNASGSPLAHVFRVGRLFHLHHTAFRSEATFMSSGDAMIRQKTSE